jgi:natural product biosynthesis luciferase-like monooxygenase protein
MEFGLQFFPDIGPEIKAADVYWRECLQLTALADELEYTHIRTVEHHFQVYGGYSPAPHIFLTAAAMRCQKARLITGAVLPIFNHPLKIAGEIGMLDAISGGRLECGFARAFLPVEFQAFDRSLDESKARFFEGMEQVRQLLENENVTNKGEFHSFSNVTAFPRPTQKPRPPFWVAALITPESFEFAGKSGFNLMAIPLPGGKMNELIKIYREAWENAGHEGRGKVMLAHHMFCHENHDTALEIAREPLNRYLKSLVDAASMWLTGSSSHDYPGYDKIIETLSKETADSQIEKSAAFIGSPERLVEQINEYQEATGGFDIASMQVNFNDINVRDAENSMRLFSNKVMPQIK